jgi:uncharacterized protein (DUF4415 family)
MSKKSSTAIPDDLPITQADIDKGRVIIRQRDASGRLLPRGNSPEKTRVTLWLDAPVVERFKHMAGGRGYQTLINETLKASFQQEDMASVIKQTIREEMRHIHEAA